MPEWPGLGGSRSKATPAGGGGGGVTYKIVIKGDSKDANKAAEDFEKKFGKSIDNVAAKLIGYNEALALGKKALGAIFDEFKRGIELARQNEITNRALTTSLKDYGIAAGAVADELNRQSAELQTVTNVSDEAIRRHQTLAMSMGASATQATGFSKAAISLANATGKTADEAILQLTKTLGGYAGELGEVLPEIKSLTASQLANGEAVDLINEKYGEFLDLEAGEDITGRIAGLGTAWDDLSEAIGSAFLNMSAITGALDAVTNSLNRMVRAVENIGLAAGGFQLLADLIAFVEGKEAIDIEAEFQGMVQRGTEQLGLLPPPPGLAPIPGGRRRAAGPPRAKKRGPGLGAPVRELPERDILAEVEAERAAAQAVFEETMAILDRRAQLATEKEEMITQLHADHDAQRLANKIQITNALIAEEERLAAEREQIITAVANKVAQISGAMATALISNALEADKEQRKSNERVIKEFLRGQGIQLVGAGVTHVLMGTGQAIATFGAKGVDELIHGGVMIAAGTAMIGGSIPLHAAPTGAERKAALGAGGAGGPPRRGGGQAEVAYGGDTIINVYGATTNEEAAILIQRAQNKRMQVGR
jgi:hypothetical protein